jgi:branched-chain amino acid transport system permease protein
VKRGGLVARLTLAVPGAVVLAWLTTRLTPFTDYQIGTGAAFLCAVAGLTVLTGTGGQLSLGQGGLMAIGAYAFALTENALAGQGTAAQWALPVSLATGSVVAAAAGAVIGLAAIRVRGAYLAGLTLALALAVPAAASLFAVFGGDQGVQVSLPVTAPAFLGADFSYETWQAWVALACALVVLVALATVASGPLGRALRAIRDNEAAAQLCGINIARVQTAAFVLTAGCAGLGGGVLAMLAQSVTSGSFSLNLSFNLVLAVVLGGLGSLAGAVWGSAVLVLLPYAASTVSSQLGLSGTEALKLSGNLPLAVSGLLLIAIVMVAPGGLQDLLRRAARGSRVRLLTGRGRTGGTGRATATTDPPAAVATDLPGHD